MPYSANERMCRQFGGAWLALAAALALHVADEALNGFLEVYNPAVRSLRAHVPWLPLPTFTFEVWLAGLVAGITVLFALTPAAFRGNRGLVVFALPFSVLMIGNALGHLGGTLYLGRALPGVWSAPVLLVAASLCLRCAIRAWRSRRHSDPGASRNPGAGSTEP